VFGKRKVMVMEIAGHGTELSKPDTGTWGRSRVFKQRASRLSALAFDLWNLVRGDERRS